MSGDAGRRRQLEKGAVSVIPDQPVEVIEGKMTATINDAEDRADD